MLSVLRGSWALLLGTLTVMVAHGLSTSLLGVRGASEGMTAFEIGIIMAGYYGGFLLSSDITQNLLRRVGHVRVYAAYAALASAVLILYAVEVDPVLWTILRFVNGACLAGMYIVAESWLNGVNANQRRGQALGVYVASQLFGLVLGQWLLTTGEPAGYELFVIGTVLMSLGVGPVLLSVSPVPVFETARPISLRELYDISPLACVGFALLGLGFSVIFSMLSVYAILSGLDVTDVAAMVAAVYVGGALVQYPAGWISDKIGRRVVITALSAGTAAAAAVGLLSTDNFVLLLAVSFVVGGGSSPLYSVLLAHANDQVESDRMASCGARMVFLQGVGSFLGPLLAGVFMNLIAPWAYFAMIGSVFGALGFYSVYRSAKREMPIPEEAVGVAPLPLKASLVATEMYIETTADAAEEAGGMDRPAEA